jgi:hypothetical protein
MENNQIITSSSSNTVIIIMILISLLTVIIFSLPFPYEIVPLYVPHFVTIIALHILVSGLGLASVVLSTRTSAILSVPFRFLSLTSAPVLSDKYLGMR